MNFNSFKLGTRSGLLAALSACGGGSGAAFGSDFFQSINASVFASDYRSVTLPALEFVKTEI